LADNTANNIGLTGVNLHVGTIPGPFSYRSLAEELRLCDRYYQRYDFPSANQSFSSGHCNTSTAFVGSFRFRTPMRDTSITDSVSNAADFEVNASATATATTAVTFGEFSLDGCGVSATVASGLTQGEGATLRSDGTVDRWIDFDAEL
jgi:hypothetical protein